MRRLLATLLLLVACGGDDQPAVPDAAAAIDAPLAVADARPPDAAPEPDAPASLGQLCATTAPDGGPGSCPGGVCCSAGGTTRCTLPDDCPAGGGYRTCTGGADCQGSICCRVSQTWVFCTKPAACAAYGGTEIP
jgi:hypothetical protein